MVYDITSRETFENITSWLEECKVNGNPEMTLVLVGNKTDLPSERQVSFNDGEQFAQKNGMLFFEVSAKTDSRIGEIFVQSAKMVNEKIKRNTIDPKNEMYGVKPGTMSMLNTDPSHTFGLSNKTQKKSCC